ncbi:MAG TPA: pyridoxal-phosphate dependent enzyme [Casimicrobiaceae bacterium]|jgi:threonine dehydratase|nr:pyridoxal-phosphate dependent enzyme [Casimicrobiaceae bacterium]
MGATDTAAEREIAVDLATVRAAHARIRPHVHRTPVLTSRSLDAAMGATLFFKCENLQKVGAFKARGACNAVFSLDDAEARRGVITHSSGNHGAAVAWAAARRGIPAWVVMPENSAEVKKAAVQGLGAAVRYCAPTLAARDTTCAAVQAETGALLIHPFDDWRVIAGQGTAALELLEEIPDLDAILTPVGGGGLLSGTAIAARAIKPSIAVYGAEPAGADDAWRSLQSGHIVPQTDPRTIADGLRSSLGVKTFAVLSKLVDAIGTTSEPAIVQAMRLAWEKLKLIIEPSSAVPLAALLERKLPVAGRRVGIVISGGNVDLDRLPWQH